MSTESHSIPNTPKPVAPPVVDPAHPAPDPEGSNATQPEPQDAPRPKPGADAPYVKPSPYTAGNY